MGKGSNRKKGSSASVDKEKKTSGASTTTGKNKPRNFKVTNADTPLAFAFTGRCGIRHSIQIQQTPDQDVWPGGAVWDSGWCLTQLVVALASQNGKAITTTTVDNDDGSVGKPKTSTTSFQLPSRVSRALSSFQSFKVILELGCGVGLTGLVAAAALSNSAKITILTDLQCVIDKVTQPNVIQNTIPASKAANAPRLICKSSGRVIAMPLCWGNHDDEQAVQALLETQSQESSESSQRLKKKGTSLQEDSTTAVSPDLVIIGDVAYQHRPGAPSHFEALVSTLLQFASTNTLVLFGTRIRMPASVDLLDMLLQHFDEVVQPPLAADEIDRETFGPVKHNMGIHFLKQKAISDSLV